MEPQWTSIVLPPLAVALALITREAIFSLVIACLAGVLLLGQGIQGFPGLVTRSLGNEGFISTCAIELCIGVLVAFFQQSGAIDLFRQRVSRNKHVKYNWLVSVRVSSIATFIPDELDGWYHAGADALSDADG